jgi:periplasmic divalent cation tolerance protein
MTGPISVYITTPSRDLAERIARTVVEEKLAACVNIFTGVHSIYRWKGRVESADEVILIAKTRRDLFDALEKRVKELHSYEVPCIVAWPIEAGHKPYLDWLEQETTG